MAVSYLNELCISGAARLLMQSVTIMLSSRVAKCFWTDLIILTYTASQQPSENYVLVLLTGREQTVLLKKIKTICICGKANWIWIDFRKNWETRYPRKLDQSFPLIEVFNQWVVYKTKNCLIIRTMNVLTLD